MIIIKNRFIPVKGFNAMFFFGILFVRSDSKKGLTYVTLNHESIHAKQCVEMLGVFFYLWYVVEYIIRIPLCDFDTHKAYRNISFEREAYDNQENMEYISERRHFAWLNYIKRK